MDGELPRRLRGAPTSSEGVRSRGWGWGADGRLLSVSRAPAVPAASPASAAPPPTHDLPASAAAARAQRSRRGQNSNLFPNE
jgi:hypothetical protein